MSGAILAYTLTLRSPFLSRGLSQGRISLDASQARDPQTGHMILSGTLLRGLLKHILKDVADAGCAVVDNARLERWFGAESDPAATGPRQVPCRGLLHFEDLEAALPPEKATTSQLVRVALDPALGSVRHGHLQTVELPVPVGREVRFAGRVRLLDDGEAVAVERALRLALDMLPAVGAFKSLGFGRVVGRSMVRCAGLRRQPAAPGPVARSFAGVEAAQLVLCFLDPFCVDAEAEAANVAKGSPIAPGGVIKGALARQLAGDPSWAQAVLPALAAIVVGHAQPVRRAGWPDDANPVPWPQVPHLALVAGGKADGLHDMLTGKAPGWAAAPRYQVDWKDKDRQALPPRFRPPHLRHDARTRTAIDAQQSAAAPQELFSELSVIPEDDPRQGRLRWLARLDQGAAPGPGFATFLSRLDGLELGGIGRTGARALLRVVPLADPKVAAATYDAGRYALCLESPALLNDARALRAGSTLLADYAAYWQRVSGGSLALAEDGFWARQRLAGRYQAIRYPVAAAYGGSVPAASIPYEPWLLTEPGSVFRLEIVDAAMAKDRVEAWLRCGLPLNPAVWPAADWRTCPFVPENGYGAVRCALAGEHMAPDR